MAASLSSTPSHLPHLPLLLLAAAPPPPIRHLLHPLLLLPLLSPHNRKFLPLRAQSPPHHDASSSHPTRNPDFWKNDADFADTRQAKLGDDELLRVMGMEDDIRRLSKKREIEKLLENKPSNGSSVSVKNEGALKDLLDNLLVADFFFIIVSLVWLIVGLAQKSFLHSSELIDSWLPLWPLLFQPALGIFMAGALFSAGFGYFSRK